MKPGDLLIWFKSIGKWKPTKVPVTFVKRLSSGRVRIKDGEIFRVVNAENLSKAS